MSRLRLSRSAWTSPCLRPVASRPGFRPATHLLLAAATLNRMDGRLPRRGAMQRRSDLIGPAWPLLSPPTPPQHLARDGPNLLATAIPGEGLSERLEWKKPRRCRRRVDDHGRQWSGHLWVIARARAHWAVPSTARDRRCASCGGHAAAPSPKPRRDGTRDRNRAGEAGRAERDEASSAEEKL